MIVKIDSHKELFLEVSTISATIHLNAKEVCFLYCFRKIVSQIPRNIVNKSKTGHVSFVGLTQVNSVPLFDFCEGYILFGHYVGQVKLSLDFCLGFRVHVKKNDLARGE